MLIKGPCEVYIQKLFVVDGKAHYGPSEAEVVEVVRVDVGHAVGLEGTSCTHIQYTTKHMLHSQVICTQNIHTYHMCYKHTHTYVHTLPHNTLAGAFRCTDM